MNAAAVRALRGQLLEREPMARHNVWAVGGAAERFFVPADLDDLAAFLAHDGAKGPLFWLGLGSNLLVRDGGMDGTVIAVSGKLDQLELAGQQRIRVGAGVPCAKVARFAARAGLAGAAFLAGIPGTMGGALAMNAGAFGGETWPLVARVETMDAAGRRRWRPAADYQFTYRQVLGPADEWFVACELALQPGDPGASRDAIRALLAKRAATQPTGQRSCGSVFRNPPGDYAGRLIEAAGLKGERRGGASVSSKHANFIINDGTASAADLEALIMHVQAAVQARFAIALVPEVRIVGRHG